MCSKSLAGTLVALLLVTGAAAASAQEVTPAERDRALQYWNLQRRMFCKRRKAFLKSNGTSSPRRTAGPWRR
jgi:hypothetical protein